MVVRAPRTVGSLVAFAVLAAVPGLRAGQAPGVLHRYALDDSLTVILLPRTLDEISGLTFDGRGRLWAHHDEAARLFELDPASGRLLASFDVGRWGWTLGGDWEGLAWAGDRFFMVDSDGVLLEFGPGDNGERVPYRRSRTGLGRLCEIEGLAFEPDRGALLVGCKTPRQRDLAGGITLFAIPLSTLRPDPEPRVRVPAAVLDRLDLPERFAVSAVEVHPEGGTILVASARQEALAEIDATGVLLAARRLPDDHLPQTEGLAVGPDGALHLASEAAGERPRLARVPLGGAER